MKKGNKIISGALALGLGAIAAKLLGALYRVPLTRILGGEGIGLYQTVFPVYALLLDFAGAAAPSALSALIAAEETDREIRAKEYLSVSLKIFSVTGIFFSLLMLVLSARLAAWQGEAGAYRLYIYLAPAIFLSCLISSFRGYFQGLMDMKPTALSQVLEQLVKLIAGLIFSKLFMPDIIAASAGAVLGITLSEAITLLWLYGVYLRHVKRALPGKSAGLLVREKFDGECAVRLIKTAVPVTLLGLMLPLSNVVDTFILVNVLKRNFENATALFGLLSGVAMTMVGLPVAVCHGLSAVAIPAVSGASTTAEKTKNAQKTLLLTLAVSLPAAAALYFLAPLAVSLLFGGLGAEEKAVAVRIIQYLSPAVFLLSMLQTENAILIGMKKINISVIGMAVGIGVKIALELTLVNDPAIGIYGGAAAILACYFFADLINLIPIIFRAREKAGVYGNKVARRREPTSSE